jgi:transcriptional regulator with XRE-family HTH domain
MTDGMLAIFRARKAELGLRNEDLEAAAGLGDGDASKILRGVREPRAGTVERICRALKLEQKFLPVNAEKGACDFGGSPEHSDHP